MITTLGPRTRKRKVKELGILEPQAEMVEYDLDWGAARGGTRAGKSFGFALWLLFKRIIPYPLANHFVVGADYEQLRRGYFDLMVSLLDSLGWEEGIDYKYREMPSPLIEFLRLDKHVYLRSLSTRLVERIRGISIQTLLLEEPQTWGTKAYSGKRLYDILLGRLSHSQRSALIYPNLKPQGRMSFNPPPEGTWLHELIEKQWKKSGYKCWRMSVRDNCLLEGLEAYVRQLEANLDPRRQSAEIDGHWMTGGGNVYYTYDSDVHGSPPLGIPAVDLVDMTRPLLWTHDFNVSLMCSLIVQRWEQERRMIEGANPETPRHLQFTVPVPVWQHHILRVLYEFAVPNASVERVLEVFAKSRWCEIARELSQRLEFAIELCGDASGGNRSQTVQSNNWLMLVSGIQSLGITVKPFYHRSNPPVRNRVNNTNAQLFTGIDQGALVGNPIGSGYGVTIDTEKCPYLVSDLRQLDWDENGYDLKKKAGEIGDSSDAFGYLAHYEREPRAQFHVAVARNRSR